MAKTLVLIRHAHRDTTTRSKDNGLTEKGKNQARALKKYFAGRFESDKADKGDKPPKSIWLVSSPKKRCLETLAPIATVGNYEIDINPDLDEQSNSESLQKFDQRIHHFLKEWQQMPHEITLACGHGDWLPLAAFHLLGVRCDFKKGAWLELEWDGSGQLKWFIPTFKPFYE